MEEEIDCIFGFLDETYLTVLFPDRKPAICIDNENWHDIHKVPQDANACGHVIG